jgi:type VI secretion system protein VasD
MTVAFHSSLPKGLGRHLCAGAFALAVSVSASAMLVSACAAPKKAETAEPCDKQVLTVGVLATPYINPEVTGQARPVVLRIYQLKSDINFRNASFDKIWKDDAATLGADIVSQQELSVFPDSVQALNIERNPEAQYFAAVGLFREPKGRQWYSVFELPLAPGEENCLAKCPDGQCEQAVDPNPKLYLRLDGIRVEDGSAYADEFKNFEKKSQKPAGSAP